MIAVYLAMLETDVDRDKFMKLYESYEKKLFAVALRILENNEKAEDAVQQAWLRIIQHWERVRTRQNAKRIFSRAYALGSSPGEEPKRLSRREIR